MSNTPTKQIFIPSKGRAGKSNTIDLLRKAKIPFTVVVEPQDATEYITAYQNNACEVAILPENDRGLAYARNFCLDRAVSDFFWLLDDDVSGFFKVVNGVMVKTQVGKVLRYAERIFTRTEKLQKLLALGSLEYRQFAWSRKTEVQLNSYTDVVVLVNKPLLVERNIRCDEDFLLKIDRDLTLQCLSHGLTTARLNRRAFSTPENGSNAGGLQDVYKAELEERYAKKLADKWGEAVQVKKKPNGRIDAVINWRAFA